MWKRIVLGVALAAAALPAAADFEAGQVAYNRSNYVEAFQEWEPLAQSGDVEAQYRLGELYRQGFGVPQDYVAAADWYGRAAAQGHTESQFRLGWLFKLGRGVPQDFARARDWLQQAADFNNPRAQFQLGTLYFEGLGLAKDNVMAHMWLNLASVGLKGKEYQNAAIQRQLIAAEMNPDMVQRAQRMAQEWRPKEAPKAEPVAGAAPDQGSAAAPETAPAAPVAGPTRAAAPAAKGTDKAFDPNSREGKAQLEKLLGKQPNNRTGQTR